MSDTPTKEDINYNGYTITIETRREWPFDDEHYATFSKDGTLITGDRYSGISTKFWLSDKSRDALISKAKAWVDHQSVEDIYDDEWREYQQLYPVIRLSEHIPEEALIEVVKAITALHRKRHFAPRISQASLVSFMPSVAWGLLCATNAAIPEWVYEKQAMRIPELYKLLIQQDQRVVDWLTGIATTAGDRGQPWIDLVQAIEQAGAIPAPSGEQGLNDLDSNGNVN